MTSQRRRTYILDTSVLLSNPRALFAFDGHDVVLPLVVIRELESKRNDLELGGLARSALRHLEALRVNGGDLQNGVPVGASGTVRIEINHVDRSRLPDALRNEQNSDTRIMAVAAALREEGVDVVLVSKDLPMRLLASAVLGLPVEDHHGEQLPDSGYSGMAELAVPVELVDALYHRKQVYATEFERAGVDIEAWPAHLGVVCRAAGSSSALARYDGRGQVNLIQPDLEAFGVHGRSAEQRIALAHLLDPNIGIVSLGGPGGTGKSLLALAAGLEAVLERQTHKRIVVFRPMYAVGGQGLGFLPGSEAEKMDPWRAAVFDALHAFCSDNVIEEIVERGLLEVLPLTYIRGRTFTDTIAIVDEAQNLERQVLLAALSRTGENTRVFLTHDVAQRDNLHVGRYDGIAAVIERLKGESLFAHVTLTRSERSAVAELVTRLLDGE